MYIKIVHPLIKLQASVTIANKPPFPFSKAKAFNMILISASI